MKVFEDKLTEEQFYNNFLPIQNTLTYTDATKIVLGLKKCQIPGEGGISLTALIINFDLDNLDDYIHLNCQTVGLNSKLIPGKDSLG